MAISELYLLNVPITNLSNQLYFQNDSLRENYFKQRKIQNVDYELTDFSYIKKDEIIKVPFNSDYIIDCNYIMYKNTEYIEDKWFYAFVTNIKYENDGCSLLSIKEDPYQTWASKCNFHPCFVEREHVKDDTIGLHTIPENLEVGEAIAIDEILDTDYITSYIILASNYNPYTDIRYSGIGLHQGYPSGSKWFAFNYRTELNALNDFIDKCEKAGKISDITEMFAVPNTIIDYTMIGENHIVNDDSIPSNLAKDITVPKRFSSYNVKNNKCKCYPYQFLYVSNNSGVSKVYKYENFNSNDCKFRKYQLACVGCSIKLEPLNYKNLYGKEESIMLGKFPTFSWASDSYTNWLTQNAINVGVNALSSGISSSLVPIGGETALNALNNIAGAIGSIREASMLPNSPQGNVNSGDINFIISQLTFDYYNMSIKDEYLKVIDNFFTKFGYKVNIIKKPEFNTRKYWNYIKTIDCKISGNIPLSAKQEIEEMFNNGTTLWNDTNNLFNYELDNSIN